MKKVYVVCWGSGGQDDRGNSTAFCGIHGIYETLISAKEGLEEYKNEVLEEIIDPDFDEEERASTEADISVYGSVEEQHFEIDYTLGDAPCEVYIQIVEKKYYRIIRRITYE